MDDRRFDAWTRRRFGRAAGGLLAALAGLGAAETAAGKHKPKPCKSNATRCGKKCVTGECCPGKACGPKGEHCKCHKTIDGQGFCANTREVPICAACHSDADCATCSSNARCVQSKDRGSSNSGSCLFPCGFNP